MCCINGCMVVLLHGHIQPTNISSALIVKKTKSCTHNSDWITWRILIGNSVLTAFKFWNEKPKQINVGISII